MSCDELSENGEVGRAAVACLGTFLCCRRSIARSKLHAEIRGIRDGKCRSEAGRHISLTVVAS